MKLTAFFVFAGIGVQLSGMADSIPMQLEKIDPAVKALVDSDQRIERVATGFKWVEGPVWISSGYLLFAEIPSNSIRKYVPGGGTSIWLQPSGYKGKDAYNGPEPGSNGMTLDARGRLTVAGHAWRNIWRLETMNPHGQVTVLADQYEGKKLNSPNDLVYKSDGSLYFTDPPYGLRTQGDQDPHKELKVNGVYRILDATKQEPGSAPDPAKLKLLISDLTRPNGIAFSPDEKTLYIADSGKRLWMKYKVAADGSVSDGKVMYDADSDPRKGAPDGIKLDTKGNLYSSGPGGVWIFSADGKHIGTITMPEGVANMAWGDNDYKTLYITATSSLYRLRTKVAGLKP